MLVFLFLSLPVFCLDKLLLGVNVSYTCLTFLFGNGITRLKGNIKKAVHAFEFELSYLIFILNVGTYYLI